VNNWGNQRRRNSENKRGAKQERLPSSMKNASCSSKKRSYYSSFKGGEFSSHGKKAKLVEAEDKTALYGETGIEAVT